MNKFTTITTMESQIKTLEIDICFAFRERDHDKVAELRKERRNRMKDISQVK